MAAKRKVTKAKANPAKPPNRKAGKTKAKRAPSKPAKAAKRPAPAPPPPRAPGERRYWLVKTEPGVFSYADLERAPGRTTSWDGVRNYQARNTLRDQMKAGDGVLVYHSNAEPAHVAGMAEVVGDPHPDPTQFDPTDSHHDPAAKRDAPIWFAVDVKAVRRLRPIGLPELRETPGLERMVLLQQGSRLSVQPVSAAEWTIVTKLGGA